ncbi:MAG: hypothetical protein R3293_14880 [Candidatus Promineifilaceae bacterium]|nr:hypothetical protein [Candidatus Promineifilaceae bacterium]
MTQLIKENRITVESDRILPFTRAVAWALIPFLLAAFIYFYFGASQGREWFSGEKLGPLSAAFIIAGYLSAAYFLLRVGLGPRRHQVHLGAGYLASSSYTAQGSAQRWHAVHAGFPPAILLLLSSFLAVMSQSGAFDSNSVSYLIWMGLALVGAVLLFAAWLINRRRDPRQADFGERLVPNGIRVLAAIIGGLLVVFSAAAWIWPAAMTAVWPWRLTLLGAKLIAGWYAALGVGLLSLAADRRWSSWLIPLQSAAISFVLLLLALLRYQDNLSSSGLVNWTMISILMVLAGVIVLALFMRVQTKVSG